MKKLIKGILIILLLLILVLIFIGIDLNKRIINLTRLDKDGILYYADYQGDYYDTIIELPLKYIASTGCSSFVTHNEKDEVITARNYDFPHLDSNGNITGMNLVLKTDLEGKYSSISIADMGALAEVLGPNYFKGNLSSYKKLLAAYAPYIAVDGMNEKGVSISLMTVFPKEGESKLKQTDKGKKSIIAPVLARYILDECSTTEEAIELAKKYNMTNLFGNEYHIFVNDANANSILLEWRNNELKIVKTDVSTNFYQSSDDGSDFYKNGKLKESLPSIPDNLTDYHYGYGYGYQRFITMANAISNHTTDGYSKMDTTDIINTLYEVKQEYDGTELTSSTQYSVLFNNTKKEVEIYFPGHYNERKIFNFK